MTDDDVLRSGGRTATGAGTETDEPDARRADDGSPSTLLNALVGAAATVVLAFVPLSPLLGGALAGYLQGPDGDAGIRVGAISGLFATFPLALFALLVFLLGAFFAIAQLGLGIAFVLFVLVVLVVLAVYTVGLSALGGWLGAYLKRET